MNRDTTQSRIPYLIKVLCFIAAFHPNCTRCCPVGFGSCQCEWAWEDCPQQQGCNGCGNSGCSSAATSSPLIEEPTVTEAGAAPHAQQAIARDDASTNEPSGTLAFVATEHGTFAVAALAALDRVRIVRVDVNALDEDPLTVRTVGEVAFRTGDEPGRVISDGRGRALVVLRGGGVIATIDPLTASVVEQRRVCDAPRSVVLDAARDRMHVACASGELSSMRWSDGMETRRVPLGTELDGVALVIDVSGAIASPKYASFGPIADVATTDDATAIVTDDDAFFRARAETDFERVGAPGITRSIALADVTSVDAISRRVLALQTSSPRMLVLFTVKEAPAIASLEPLQ